MESSFDRTCVGFTQQPLPNANATLNKLQTFYQHNWCKKKSMKQLLSQLSNYLWSLKRGGGGGGGGGRYIVTFHSYSNWTSNHWPLYGKIQAKQWKKDNIFEKITRNIYSGTELIL